MTITIITLFPEMIQGFVDNSIVKRAREKKQVEIDIVNLRDFAIDSYGTVDGRPYGGGAGMVFRPDVLYKAIKSITNYELRVKKQKIILTSAKGSQYNQNKALELSKLDHIIIIAGHYEGVDERVLDIVDEEISIGDFVLTGGEIPAVAIVDSIVRLLPGVLKKEDATEEESFFEVELTELVDALESDKGLEEMIQNKIQKVKLLEYPQYTRPEIFEGKKVPEILLSGDPKKIRKYHLKEAFLETKKKRPDLLQIG